MIPYTLTEADIILLSDVAGALNTGRIGLPIAARFGQLKTIADPNNPSIKWEHADQLTQLVYRIKNPLEPPQPPIEPPPANVEYLGELTIPNGIDIPMMEPGKDYVVKVLGPCRGAGRTADGIMIRFGFSTKAGEYLPNYAAEANGGANAIWDRAGPVYANARLTGTVAHPGNIFVGPLI